MSTETWDYPDVSCQDVNVWIQRRLWRRIAKLICHWRGFLEATARKPAQTDYEPRHFVVFSRHFLYQRKKKRREMDRFARRRRWYGIAVHIQRDMLETRLGSVVERSVVVEATRWYDMLRAFQPALKSRRVTITEKNNEKELKVKKNWTQKVQSQYSLWR